MGLLIDGVWHDQWYDTKKSAGKFQRSQSQFRNWVTPDGTPGPSGKGGFAAESGRYHLYVAHACPWAHRAMLFRAFKDLAPHISVSIVDPLMLDKGWVFSERPGTLPDTVNGASAMSDIYVKADPGYSGRVTVPVLWDKAQDTIVSNESSEIIRMFNSAFDGLTCNTADYYPETLRTEIDAINAVVYDAVNNGVYKCGFATTQAAYEEAFDALFDALDMLEARLSGQAYLVGDTLTEADWRLFTTLLRFDPVYVGHFKCNKKRLVDYPALFSYTRALYQMPGVAETANIDQIKEHYYASHETINPTRIVPKGPEIDFSAPHDRGRFTSGHTA